MDHITGFIDAVIRIGLTDDFTFDGNPYQARRGDLFVQQAVEIDEQVLRAKNTCRTCP